MLYRKLLSSFLIILAVVLFQTNIANAQKTVEKARIAADGRYLLAPGYGEVIVKPLKIELAVLLETIADTEEETRAKNKSDLNFLILKLKNSGIKHTLSFSHIIPIERRELPVANKVTKTKYVILRSLDVTLKEADKIKEFSDLALEAGAKKVEARNYILDDVKKHRKLAYNKALSNAHLAARELVSDEKLGMSNPRVISQRGGRRMVSSSRVSDSLRVAKNANNVILDGSAESLVKAAEIGGVDNKNSLVAIFTEIWLGADIVK